MQRKFPWWPIPALMLVLAGIAIYNYWAYSCGFCALQDMKTIGPQAKAVAYLNLVAIFSWFVLFCRRLLREGMKMCQCGRQIEPDWVFCPDCGSPAK